MFCVKPYPTQKTEGKTSKCSTLKKKLLTRRMNSKTKRKVRKVDRVKQIVTGTGKKRQPIKVMT